MYNVADSKRISIAYIQSTVLLLVDCSIKSIPLLCHYLLVLVLNLYNSFFCSFVEYNSNEGSCNLLLLLQKQLMTLAIVKS